MSERCFTWRHAAMTLPCFFLALAAAQAPPNVPQSLRVPAGEQLMLKTHAQGVQIYQCVKSAEGATQWSLTGPEAQLHDDAGAKIGRHFAGPSWELRDGSSVLGKALAHEASPDAQSVAWLLVTVVGHKGQGKLSSVTSIQRLNTHGGQPPPATQCTADAAGKTVQVPYSADYYFYAPAAPH